MYSCNQDKHLMAKMTHIPDVVSDDDNHYAACHRSGHQRETTRKTTPARGVDESDQGPKRSRSQSLARPLGIQSNVNNHCRLLLQIGQLLGYCSYKVTHSAHHYGVLRRWRRCCCSRISGWRLLKAVQESSLANPSGHWPLHRVNNCKAPWRRYTQEPSVFCISGYICRSPPPAYQYDRGLPPPPPQRAEERCRWLRQLPGRDWAIVHRRRRALAVALLWTECLTIINSNSGQ
jgi:hypothetical protein